MSIKMNYPKTLDNNLNYRAEIIAKANKDKKLAAILWEMCRDDILFWFNTFAYTYDPRLNDPVLPFITYEYQDKYITDTWQAILNDEDTATEKSRDMGYSWMITAIFTYAFLFHQMPSLLGSYKEDYVDSKGNMDSLFEKIRFMLDHLPKWMMPDDIIKNYMAISSKQLGADITWDAWENFGTGWRRRIVFMDEFQAWATADKTFRKTRDITNCRIFWWTPEGRHNLYGKIMTGHEDYKHLGIKKFRLHRSQHPKKDQAWYEKQKQTRTKLDIAKELDISYDDSVTWAVYKDFTTLSHFWHYPFTAKLPLYTTWDFGRDTTAIQWWQKDHQTWSLYKVDSIKRVDWDIKKIYAFVTWVWTSWYTYTEAELDKIAEHSQWKPHYTNHFGDPYNADSRTVVTTDTIRSELAKVGIYLQTRRDSSVEDRIRKVTLWLPRLYIDETDYEFIHDITQARYPQIKENNQNTTEKTKPIHDSTSHHRTALEYFVDNEPVTEKLIGWVKQWGSRPRTFIDPGSGQRKTIGNIGGSFNPNQYR